MVLFEYEDYKAAIRYKVKETKRQGKALSLRQVAEGLRIQYTYLSKVLNDKKSHLSEDHLFAIGEMLGLLPEEVDFLSLLRAIAITQHPKRREYLLNKAHSYRRQQGLSAEVQKFEARAGTEEMHYLFDPYAVVVHVALLIPDYAAHPRRLCSLLGISAERLDLVLSRLAGLGFIELDDRRNIKEVKKSRLHYGTDHPLMRAHQQMLSALCQTHLLRVDEADRQRFMTTFTGSVETYRFLSEKLGEVIRQAQQFSRDFPSAHVFQFNYEIFRWL